jgi:hypothetical protein
MNVRATLGGFCSSTHLILSKYLAYFYIINYLLSFRTYELTFEMISLTSNVKLTFEMISLPSNVKESNTTGF